VRIGIFNRWLGTMGGGEQYTAAVAEVLAADHDVELLTVEPVDMARFRRRLGVDLTALPMRIVPYDVDFRSVQEASCGYDLFVNVSQGDVFPALARHNAMVVFFPGPLPDDTAPPATGSDAAVIPLSGLLQPEPGMRRHVRWTGDTLRLLVRRPPGSSASLRLVVAGLRAANAPAAVVHARVDGEPITAPYPLPRRGWVDWRVPLPPAAADERLVVDVVADAFVPADYGLGGDTRRLGVAVHDVCLVGHRRGRLRHGRDSSLAAWSTRRRTEIEIGTYTTLLAISRYTEAWVRTRWDRTSELLYPRVAVERFTSGTKRPWILSVGRFFVGSHNKGHLQMVRAFQTLCDQGLRGWELHLAGGTHDEARHQDYLRQVVAEASGYPIQIHPDIDGEALRDLYASSRIYWNATGLGQDAEREPEVFEHFGITTVEAMAAGSVPVVLAQAGQPEIVEHGESGLLWEDVAQWLAETRGLIEDPQRCDRLGRAAAARARDFGAEPFARTLRTIVAGIEQDL
jgi:glycosyltransferase involved in cell wall biosynthesis